MEKPAETAAPETTAPTTEATTAPTTVPTTTPPETTVPETEPEPPEETLPEPVFVEYPIVEPNTCVTEELLHHYVDTLCAKYPGLLRQDTYGTSVMGRPLVYLTMGYGETEVCAVAGMHSWEHINTL